jgi:hypothetical protein
MLVDEKQQKDMGENMKVLANEQTLRRFREKLGESKVEVVE